jgi:hypothetical protein
VVDLILNHWIIAFYKPGENRRPLEHIDVIVGTDHGKEKVKNK